MSVVSRGWASARYAWLLSLALACAVGCNSTDSPDDRSTPSPTAGMSGSAGMSASAGAKAGASGGAGAGGTSAGGTSAGGSSDCVVARKLDECCPRFVPAFRAQLDADECLVAYGSPVDPKLSQKCFEKAGDRCALVDCAVQPEPPSRHAADVGNNRCVFTDECGSKAEDCVLAFDGSACCSCLTAMPADLVASSRCLVPEGKQVPSECGFCGAVLCDICPAPPAAAQCELRDSFSACVGVP